MTETILRFKIDQKDLEPESNRLTGFDFETFERYQEGEELGSYRVKRLAARFMVDETGKKIPYDRALRVFDALKSSEYIDGLKQFMEAISDAAVPKGSGMPLNSTTAHSSRKPAASLDGSSLSKQPKNGDAPLGSSPENISQTGGDLSGEHAETSTPKK